MAVGEAFPTGPAFLLAKSSFPSLKTPTVLSQQELGNHVGKDFANRVRVFANSLALLAKHAFPVVRLKNKKWAQVTRASYRPGAALPQPAKGYYVPVCVWIN
jgi:hypothetical protein